MNEFTLQLLLGVFGFIISGLTTILIKKRCKINLCGIIRSVSSSSDSSSTSSEPHSFNINIHLSNKDEEGDHHIQVCGSET